MNCVVVAPVLHQCSTATDAVKRHGPTLLDEAIRSPYFRAIEPVWFSSTIWCPKIRWFITIFLHLFEIAILGLCSISREMRETSHIPDSKVIHPAKIQWITVCEALLHQFLVVNTLYAYTKKVFLCSAWRTTMDLLFGNSNFRGFGFGYSNSQRSLNPKTRTAAWNPGTVELLEPLLLLACKQDGAPQL